MSDPAASLIVAVEAALRASTDLATAMGGSVRVYSTTPTNAPLPYVVFGEDQIIGDDDDCTDASEAICTIHAWSKPNPPSTTQARQIGAAIRAALATQLTLSDHVVNEWRFEDAQYLTDPDLSTHAILTFHYWLTPL